jgi:formylglycine-generating enzyme required for sulfatase activity
MGSEDLIAYLSDGESPVREVHVDPFEIDVHTVTNAEFGAFIEATCYTPDLLKQHSEQIELSARNINLLTVTVTLRRS